MKRSGNKPQALSGSGAADLVTCNEDRPRARLAAYRRAAIYDDLDDCIAPITGCSSRHWPRPHHPMSVARLLYSSPPFTMSLRLSNSRALGAALRSAGSSVRPIAVRSFTTTIVRAKPSDADTPNMRVR